MLLDALSPSDRALVWGVVGGVPLYLTWWDQQSDLRSNLERLVCTPGGRLLDEGRLVLATEGEMGLRPLTERLDDHMGERWEEAFRTHLRRLATAGALAPDIVRIGAFWSQQPPVEIDAVALAGHSEEAVLAGEAKWARKADGEHIVSELRQKAGALPRRAADMRYAVCAREQIVKAPTGTIAVTAADIFD
jgi:Archaea bacterial proteins of unknown function